MENDSWKKGLRMLEPGIYVDERRHLLHLDCAELLQAKGYAVTEANIEMLESASRKVFDELVVEVHEG